MAHLSVAMSCDEKNNKRRKKRSKQSSEGNSHAPKSVENREGGKAVQTHVNSSDVKLSQILYNSTPKSDNAPKAGTPCIDGERCLLCHKERYDKLKKGELKSLSCNSTETLVSQVPLWVCPDCRRNIEEEERRAALEPSSPSNFQDLKQKPTLNLTLSITTKPNGQEAKSHCQSCNRSCVKPDVINDLAKEKERQQLRCCWGEVRNIVRCIYREAGTSLADEEETVRNSLDENRLRVKVDKLLKSDPAQLFEKLEIQAREYVREVKVRLVKYLTSCPLSPTHAKEFFTMLLDEYQALSKAFDILRPFFCKLDLEHLREFGLSWDLLHKHLFYTEIYRDPAVYGNLPGLITQLRLGAMARENFQQDIFPSLLHRYLSFTDDLTEIEFSWKESEQAFKHYKEKQAKLREKSGIPKVEWEDDLTGMEWKNRVLRKPIQQRCQCGHCNVPSSPLNSPVTSLPPFKPGTSHSKLLPPALMMNGLGNTCHCPACSGGTTGYREGAKITEQPPSGMIVGCQCSKCPFHGTKDQETRLKSDSKNLTNHASPAVHVPTPNNNHIHSNHCHPQHIVPPPPTPLHCPLEDPPQDLSGLLLDSSLRQINYNGYHNNLDGCAEVDGGENSLSDSNSEFEDDDDDDDDEDDDDEEEEDDGSSCSPRRTSQCSDVDGLGLDVPPGSPSSVRSSGDGSSCDTPPVNQCSSSTDDGRTDRGKYCDCCYCEFFGHAAPPVAPTSHNYTEMRDKLRSRLNKRQPNQAVQEDKKNAPVVDHRSVDDLLTFINGQGVEDEGARSKSKAQKRARQKQKKAAEKEKQALNSNYQNGGKCSSAGCEKINGVHHEGSEKKIRNRQLSEDTRKREMPAMNDKNCEEGKRAQRRKMEEPKQKQREDLNECSKSRKKQSQSRQNITVSRQDSKEINGKENNLGPQRQAGEKPEKQRQDSLSQVPIPVEICKEDAQDKSDSSSRSQQKKQGKKKKKMSLDDVFLPREDIETDKLTQMDEAERELEEFKRFCMNLTPLERRERIPVNVNLKGLLSGKKNGSS